MIFIYLTLVTIGIFNVYSATFEDSTNSFLEISQPVGKQILFFIISIFFGLIILGINIKFFEHLAVSIYFFGLFLLVGLFFFGKTVSGATSWYNLFGLSIQPSELAKLFTSLMISSLLSKFQSDLKNTKTLLKIIGYISIPFFLIFLQPDPGTALVFFAFFFPLFREGLNYAYFIVFICLLLLFFITISFDLILAIGIIIFLIFTIFLFLKRYNPKIKNWTLIILFLIATGFSFSVDFIFNDIFEQRHRDRINLVLGKEVDTQGIGYNINQSKIAIGSGGLKGKGFLQGTQTKGNFVPEQHTDYIFSTIGEEWGFLGSIFVIILFCFFITRVIIKAEKQTSRFRRVFCYCFAGLIFTHFFINIGMSLGLVPTIGIPLPFISYGGSSLFTFSVMFFIFLNFDLNRLNDW
tara:strand:- start:317 stop:1540 length:1224 start_codon:yes stop_codon:yes gene_type:complete